MQASYLAPQARELGAERRPVRRVFGMRVAHEVADQRGIALGEHQRATETVGVCREREDLCHLGRLPIEVPGQLRRPRVAP
jgi:hypothetical protein